MYYYSIFKTEKSVSLLYYFKVYNNGLEVVKMHGVKIFSSWTTPCLNFQPLWLIPTGTYLTLEIGRSILIEKYPVTKFSI